ncbi:MAG: HAD-IA family hydrolase [Anaerolineae bacterium]|nr:HAD-IA family hydrolase [Anaerolineae bacterium]
MFRNIIWDVDGTLFDTYPPIARAFQAALNDLGENVSLKWIEGLARKSLGHCVSTLADKYQLNEENIVQEFKKHYSCTQPEENPPFPGVITICQYICANGGKNAIVTHRGREGTAQLLAANNMAAYFVGCLTRDDGYPRKPDPAVFEAILKAHHLKREETITVGDREIDILAGQAAGVATCFFGPETETIDADLVISDFRDLHRFLVSENS